MTGLLSCFKSRSDHGRAFNVTKDKFQALIDSLESQLTVSSKLHEGCKHYVQCRANFSFNSYGRLAAFENNIEEALGTKLVLIRPPDCLNMSYQHSIDAFKKVQINRYTLINKITINHIEIFRTFLHSVRLKLS